MDLCPISDDNKKEFVELPSQHPIPARLEYRLGFVPLLVRPGEQLDVELIESWV